MNDLIMWVVFGAVIGFVADYLDKSVSLSWPERIGVGVVGSVVGGTLYTLITTGTLALGGNNNFDVISMLVALLGALLSIYVWKKVRK